MNKIDQYTMGSMGGEYHESIRTRVWE